MRTLALVLIAVALSPSCVAQKTKPTPPTTPATTTSNPTACHTVLKCRAELKEATEAANQFSNIADKLTTERDQLAAANKDLEASKAKLAARLEGAMAMLKVLDKEMRFATLTDDDNKSLAAIHDDEILNLGIALEKDQNEYAKVVQKLVGDNDSVVQKYNALLTDYKNYVTLVGIQLARIGQANRVSNTLALYNAMPKYTPPQQINIQVSDCTRLPALCVH
jgi:glutamate-1-semialdehyde aminotransferase